MVPDLSPLSRVVWEMGLGLNFVRTNTLSRDSPVIGKGKGKSPSIESQ
jgi:hypothetical protein